MEGLSTQVGCQRCGTRSREGSRFCGGCGTALGSGRAGVRKTVTVVFAELVGLVAHDDVELDARDRRAAYGVLRAVLEQHGGAVERHAGDALMAVFGIPLARDDDAPRAAAAALALHEVAAELPGGARLRVGVNTGEVVAGDATAEEQLAVGDAVVVAARLQQHAAAGETLLGSATARLLQDALVGGPVRDVVLRGRSGTTEAVPLLGLAEPRPTGRRTPFVGRDAERRMLAAALVRSAQSTVVPLITVHGEPGVGKSRLVREVLVAAPDLRVARAVCRGYGESGTWSPVGSLLEELGGEALAQRAPAGVLPALLTLRGHGDVSAVEELAQAVDWVLRDAAASGPLVLVLEDLHHAASPLLDLLAAVLRRLDGIPAAVVVTARPELLEHRTDWGAGLRHVVNVTLRSLGDEEAAELAARLVPDDADAQRELVSAAGGNPDFLEQLAKARLEGVAAGAGDAPATVAAVLAARLDRLSVEVRAVLERAAVVGSGTERDLAPLCAGLDVGDGLAELQSRDLLRRDGESWQLSSELVREVALQGMGRDGRVELHQTRAQALVDQGQPAAAGFHLEQAALLLRSTDTARAQSLAEGAADQLERAGSRELSGDLVSACGLLRRALALRPAGSAARLPALVDLARGLQLTGDLAGARAALEEAVTGAVEVDRPEVAAHARLGLCDLRRSTEPEVAYAELPGLLEQVVPVLEASGDDRGLSLAWQLQASSAQYRVRWADMAEPLQRATRHAERAGDRRLLETAQSLEVGSTFHGPMPLSRGRARLEQLRAQPDLSPWQHASITARLAGALALQGDLGGARSLLAESRATFSELGRDLSALATAFIGGPVSMLAGDAEAAVEELHQAVTGLRAMGDRAFASTLAALLAEARWRQGDRVGASAAADQAQALAAAGDVISQVRWRAVQAKAAAARQEVEAARQLSDEAVALVLDTDELVSQGDVWADAAEVRVLLGRSEEVGSLLAEAERCYRLKEAPQAVAVLRQRFDGFYRPR